MGARGPRRALAEQLCLRRAEHVDRALRAVTIDAAYILGVEDKLGSLEPGKFADFVVLGDDPYAVD